MWVLPRLRSRLVVLLSSKQVLPLKMLITSCSVMWFRAEPMRLTFRGTLDFISECL